MRVLCILGLLIGFVAWCCCVVASQDDERNGRK